MTRIFGGLAVILGLAGCVPDPTVDGRRAFIEDCSACHGTDARGGGSFGQQLIKVPPDLTGLALANGGTFPRDRVMSTIDGFRRGDHFSEAMPRFGEGDMGPTIIVEDENGIGTPVPARLLALAEYLETLQRR
jgi:mono/diheme cytochrome c family protein